MTKWKKETQQVVMDWYRNAWNTSITLEEAFCKLVNKYHEEASPAEMRAYFEAQTEEWRAFYSDSKTVACLMACNY